MAISTNHNPAERKPLPVIQKTVSAYKQWHSFLPNFPKTARYTLGLKIDTLFTDVTELIFSAIYQSKENKISYIEKAITKLDLLKFFLQVSWEIKALDGKKYIALSEQLYEVGRMLGGWARQTKNSLAPPRS
jgi:hypothetical protein